MQVCCRFSIFILLISLYCAFLDTFCFANEIEFKWMLKHLLQIQNLKKKPTWSILTAVGYEKYFMMRDMNIKTNMPIPIKQTQPQNTLLLVDLDLASEGTPCMDVRSTNQFTACFFCFAILFCGKPFNCKITKGWIFVNLIEVTSTL